MAAEDCSIAWVGEWAATLEVHGPATLHAQQRLWSLAARLRPLPGVREVVTGMGNLCVALEPGSPGIAQLPEQVREAWRQAAGAVQPARVVEIPVSYGGEDGPDLDEVARHAGLPADEVVRLHAAAEYTVYFLGFMPGFAYLGGLDARLATPRRAVPRVAVPAGSVGIGGSQTGVYPWAAPGGWQLIGRTSLRLFDAGSASPALLAPGDTVRFVPAGDRR